MWEYAGLHQEGSKEQVWEKFGSTSESLSGSCSGKLALIPDELAVLAEKKDQRAVLGDCRSSRGEAEQLVTRGICRKMLGLGEQKESCDTL